MKYIIEFIEEATVRRLTQCEVDAESEQEAEEKVKAGDYMFIDTWDDDDLGSKFIEISSIEEADEDEE